MYLEMLLSPTIPCWNKNTEEKKNTYRKGEEVLVVDIPKQEFGSDCDEPEEYLCNISEPLEDHEARVGSEDEKAQDELQDQTPRHRSDLDLYKRAKINFKWIKPLRYSSV